MSTRLTIDEGNSSTKAALWHDDVMVAVSSYARLDEALVDIGRRCRKPADTLIFCSVCRRDSDEIRSRLAPLAHRTLVLSASLPLPLRIGYRSPATLGADRIASAVGAAAIHPGRTCLVVDMGTAITYDVVTADGEYLGGNIAPGIFVRLEALEHFTSALPLVETDGDVPRWGYDTETALRAGAIRGVVGELQYYRHCLQPDAAVVLTGGSTNLITDLITSPVTVEPNLVLIGLNRIINHNEDI